MKKSLLSLIVLLAGAASAFAQTVINIPVKQNPLFEVSTNSVDASMPNAGMTLGADIVIVGGSGTYTYEWADPEGNIVGHDATLSITKQGSYRLTVSDTCDCKQVVSFNITLAGIDGVNADSALNVSASNGTLYIQSPAAVKQVTLVSMAGIMAALYNFPAENIDVTNLQSGTYIVTVTTVDGQTLTRKLAL